jgi:hypothetical protein
MRSSGRSCTFDLSKLASAAGLTVEPLKAARDSQTFNYNHIIRLSDCGTIVHPSTCGESVLDDAQRAIQNTHNDMTGSENNILFSLAHFLNIAGIYQCDVRRFEITRCSYILRRGTCDLIQEGESVVNAGFSSQPQVHIWNDADIIPAREIRKLDMSVPGMQIAHLSSGQIKKEIASWHKELRKVEGGP